MRSIHRLVLVLGGCAVVSLVGLLGVSAYSRLWPGGPPRAWVETRDRRVVAKWPPEEIIATYDIVNRGGRNLVLGEATTSCGCSIASIEPRVIKPGRKAVVTVRGTPPSAGIKTVEIKVSTNSEESAELVMHLTMVGSAPPPFVVSHNGPISLGPIRRDSPPAFLKIDTREFATERPWLHLASGSPSFIEFRGGLAEEHALGNNVALRRYAYEVKVLKVPPPGPVGGEVVFSGDEGGGPSVLTIPVHGFVNPGVYASPKSLYANLESGKEKPALIVTLVADDLGFQLEAVPSPISCDALEVRRLKAEKGRATFSVSPRDNDAQPISTTLIFTTNHPESPSVKVPVTFRGSEHGRDGAA